MIAQLPRLNAILERHDVPQEFWPEIRAFLEEGVRPNEELMARLRHVANYTAAVNEAASIRSRRTTTNRRCRMSHC